MHAEIVAIGTELLLGFTVNTDTVFLSRRLAELGIGVYHHVTVGDNPQRLRAALDTALDRADIVITCGGLGPTVDDITLETIAKTIGSPLVLKPQIQKQIEDKFKQIKKKLPKNNLRQATVPKGATVFANKIGTAPGFLVKTKRGIVIALPGPPYELEPMVDKQLLPKLRKLVPASNVLLSRAIKLTGEPESTINAQVKDLLTQQGDTTLGIYAKPGEVTLRITASSKTEKSTQAKIKKLEREIHKRFGSLIYGADDDSLEGVVGTLLIKKKQTLATAESCTGGLVGHRITEVPGSSDYYKGGMQTYSNTLKTELLNVPEALLKKHGAVSVQVAKAMAKGLCDRTGADIGIALTGIAGPGGGSKNKPVGLVYIGMATSKGITAQAHHFSGTRSMVKFKASQAALDTVRRHLLNA